MAETVVTGSVSGLDGTYKDGSPRVELRVQGTRAAGLPFLPGKRVPVQLKLGTYWYDGRLHATADGGVVFTSPDLTRDGRAFKLGKVLAKFGVELNEPVQMHAQGARIQVRDKWGQSLHTSASRLNRAIGTTPKSLDQICAESGVRNMVRV